MVNSRYSDDTNDKLPPLGVRKLAISKCNGHIQKNLFSCGVGQSSRDSVLGRERGKRGNLRRIIRRLKKFKRGRHPFPLPTAIFGKI